MKHKGGVPLAIDESDVLIVGAGLYGLVCARELAELGLRVLVIEKRNHLGGNAFSEIDSSTGIEVHKYGSHLFHTSNERVWEWVNQFSGFNDYRHSVYSIHAGRVFEIPPTLRDLSHFFPGVFSAQQAREAISGDIPRGVNPSANLEEKGISLVGEKVFRALFAGYTAKQWQTDPALLPSDYLTRLPFRLSHESGYFRDRFQGLPLSGYGQLIARIVDHRRIRCLTEIDFFDFRSSIPRNMPVIYTGPIDQYFDFSEGPLGWRTLDFEFMTLDTSDFQSTAVMNYADLDVPWTRIHEFKHLHPERRHHDYKTIIAKEYSRKALLGDEPYYPVSSPNDRKKLLKYRARAKSEKSVFFGGRLATYLYLDMHMAIASALKDFDQKYASFVTRTA